MKMRIHALGATLLLVAASALAFAAADGLVVKWQAKEGQTNKLRLKASFELSGIQAAYSALVTQKVTKVDTDGAFTVEENQTEVKASLNGQDLPADKASKPFVTVYNANGTVKEIANFGDIQPGAQGGPDVTSTQNAYRFENLDMLVDPGHTVNVGDTWTYQVKPDPKLGTVPARAVYKVIAEEKVNGIDTIKIHSTVKETAGDEPASVDATVWIDKTDGTIVKEESKLSNAPFPGAPAPINGTISQVRES